MESIPLFPLRTLLFPEVLLPLQIFEQRYLEMVKRCLREDRGFGMVLIRHGTEVDDVPAIYPVGTYVSIVDWHQLENGMLGIAVRGRRKFRVRYPEAQEDKLLVADVDFLDEEPAQSIGTEHGPLQELLGQLAQHPEVARLKLATETDDARLLGWQLAQLLPLPHQHKVALLEMNDPLGRLSYLSELLEGLAGE